ncbi:uncharacterized protein apold1a isoform X3 [Gasterosteus aculeatus]
MEACTDKPEVKKKPKPPKPPPKPTEPKRNDPAKWKKPTPLVPERPSDDELIQTQYRKKRAANNEEYKDTTRCSHHKRSQSEVPSDKVDFKQSDRFVRTGILHQSQKEKTPSFTSYLMHKKAEKTHNVPTKPTAGINLEKGGFFSGILQTTDETPAQDVLGVPGKLSASNDSLSDNGNKKDKGGIFSGMFKKKSPDASQTDKDQPSLRDDPADGGDGGDGSQEKGGFFSGILRRSPKLPAEGTPEQSLQTEPSDSNETPSGDDGKQQKGGVFGGRFKKSPKLSDGPRPVEGNLSAQKNLSASDDSLSEAAKAKEKGGAFSGLFKKSSRPSDSPPAEEDSRDDELSGSSDALDTKEKGGIFGGMFKKTLKPAEAAQAEEDCSTHGELSTCIENSPENKQEKGGGLFSGLLKKTPKSPRERTKSPEREAQNEPPTCAADVPEDVPAKERNIFSNMFKKPQRSAEEPAADDEGNPEKHSSGSCENLSKEKRGGLAGIFKRSASIDNLFDEEKGGLFGGLLKKTPKDAAQDRDDQEDPLASNDDLFENGNKKEKSIFSGMFKKAPKPAEGTTTDEESSDDKTLPGSRENLSEGHAAKGKTGGLAGIFKKSPKPAHRSAASNDPLNDSKDLFASCDSLAEDIPIEMSTSNDNLTEATNTPKEKKVGFASKFKKTPKAQQQEGESTEAPGADGPRRRTTIKRKKRVVSFRIKKTLPKIPKLSPSSQGSETMPLIEETFELQELNSPPESRVEHQPVEMAAYPTEGNPLEIQHDIDDDLMDWWNTVKGWAEWNETSHFQEGDEQMAMEQAADRVYMAARLFVRFFNRRGASLQHRILELLALADAADEFHKKTVKAAVGGGVASVAGSVATITGLILAPFTFGASIIVTAVGIGVATAGSITSATANITDAVHSNMDRKKLEKMIQDYQDEIKDIRECLDFVQAGMDTLQEWDFEKYSESAAKKALNHNLKHVMKEGGRAGKALMINTDKLISTVQVLGAAGGAAKAAQAISVTTGVMSALFLALDVFFLAKDSHELRKGAKTKFATKIRDVCKELQDGLLELNKVKTQLQKTMDGIEVEEYEEIEEVEEVVDVDEYESDPKKLAELEQELDLLEEKLDKKVEEGLKSKEMEKEMLMSKEERGEPEEKKDREEMVDAKNEGKTESKKPKNQSERKNPDEEKEQKNPVSIKAAKEEQPQKGKKDKDAENQVTAGKEKHQSKRDLAREDHGANKRKTGDSKREDRGGKTSIKTGGESKMSPSGGDEESEMKPEWRPRNKDAEGSRRSSDTGRPPRTEPKETGKRRDGKQSDGTRSSRGTEEAGGKDRRAEMDRSREERKGGGDAERRTEERHGSRMENARRRFETPGGEVEKKKGKREEDRGTRGSDRRSRPTSKALLEDGLNI